MPSPSGTPDSFALIRVCVCSCANNLWIVGVAVPEAPFPCHGCGVEHTKGLVIRCPSCGGVSCGGCVEKAMEKSVAENRPLKAHS